MAPPRIAIPPDVWEAILEAYAAGRGCQWIAKNIEGAPSSATMHNRLREAGVEMTPNGQRRGVAMEEWKALMRTRRASRERPKRQPAPKPARPHPLARARPEAGMRRSVDVPDNAASLAAMDRMDRDAEERRLRKALAVCCSPSIRERLERELAALDG